MRSERHTTLFMQLAPDGGEPQYYHDVESVILEEGDVYFRRHAVNFREFVGSSFIDLIRCHR